MDYYAMLTPGLASDWGEIILADARIVDFIKSIKKIDANSEDEIKELKSEYKKKEWDFIKLEFDAKDKTDMDFVQEVDDEWDSDLGESYYKLSELKSTYKFDGITKVIDFALEYDIKVIGDIEY